LSGEDTVWSVDALEDGKGNTGGLVSASVHLALAGEIRAWATSLPLSGSRRGAQLSRPS
jgi:hypothetical protein